MSLNKHKELTVIKEASDMSLAENIRHALKKISYKDKIFEDSAKNLKLKLEKNINQTNSIYYTKQFSRNISNNDYLNTEGTVMSTLTNNSKKHLKSFSNLNTEETQNISLPKHMKRKSSFKLMKANFSNIKEKKFTTHQKKIKEINKKIVEKDKNDKQFSKLLDKAQHHLKNNLSIKVNNENKNKSKLFKFKNKSEYSIKLNEIVSVINTPEKNLINEDNLLKEIDFYDNFLLNKEQLSTSKLKLSKSKPKDSMKKNKLYVLKLKKSVDVGTFKNNLFTLQNTSKNLLDKNNILDKMNMMNINKEVGSVSIFNNKLKRVFNEKSKNMNNKSISKTNIKLVELDKFRESNEVNEFEINYDKYLSRSLNESKKSMISIQENKSETSKYELNDIEINHLKLNLLGTFEEKLSKSEKSKDKNDDKKIISDLLEENKRLKILLNLSNTQKVEFLNSLNIMTHINQIQKTHSLDVISNLKKQIQFLENEVKKLKNLSIYFEEKTSSLANKLNDIIVFSKITESTQIENNKSHVFSLVKLFKENEFMRQLFTKQTIVNIQQEFTQIKYKSSKKSIINQDNFEKNLNTIEHEESSGIFNDYTSNTLNFNPKSNLTRKDSLKLHYNSYRSNENVNI